MERNQRKGARACAACLFASLAAFVIWAEDGLATIPDIRVAPLIDSHWSQANDSG